MLARFILTLASWGAITSTLSALEIPTSMLELCDQADLIVEVRPGASKAIPDANFSRLYRVQLTILNELKGKAPSDTINVIYGRDSVCADPPFYPEGKHVFAFLSWHDDIRVFLTVGRSHGTISGTEAELDVIRARIQEAVAIADEPPSQSRQARVTEWFVRCLENRATFAAGLDLYTVNLWGDPPPIAEINPLSVEQQRRVVGGMVRAGYFPECLLELIQGLKDPALEFQLLASIQQGQGGSELMKFVAQWTDNREAMRVATNYERLRNPAAEFIAAYGGIDYQAAAAKLTAATSMQRTARSVPDVPGFAKRALPGVGRHFGQRGVSTSRKPLEAK